MKPQDFTVTIPSPMSPSETIERIGRVSAWWTGGFEGAAQKVDDTFTVRFGETFVDFEVVELTGAKVVWRATDCNLDWIENKKEWAGTEIIWEISGAGGKTNVRMTHKGLVPQAECYGECKPGWTFYVSKSLRKLLTEGKGLPDGERKEGRS